MGDLVRIASTPPSADQERTARRVLGFLRPFNWLALLRLGGVDVRGRERFPREGPVLFLSNHVSLFDPFIVIATLRRPVHFLATQALWMNPWVGRLVDTMGNVPKKKFTNDLTAVRKLSHWAKLGTAVGVFPEGERTWDGRALPLVPGFERLVRLLGIPVITGRFLNSYHVWPRWSPGPRRGRQVLELDEPMSFDRATPDAAIRATLTERLRVDADTCERFPVRGRNLTAGLTNLLFACPACGHLEALVEEGSHARCARCAGRWRLGTDLVLRGEGRAPTLTVSEAAERVRGHLAARDSVGEPDRYERDGTILESEPMKLLDVTGSRSIDVAEGRLRLSAERLEVTGSPWSVPLADVLSMTVEQRRQLQVRTRDDRLYEMVMPRESVVKWDWIGNVWRRRAQAEREAASAGEQESAQA